MFFACHPLFQAPSSSGQPQPRAACLGGRRTDARQPSFYHFSPSLIERAAKSRLFPRVISILCCLQ